MTRLALAAALFLPGWATAAPIATDNSPALAECFADSECEDRALRLLGESMSEYGLVLQTDPQGISALTNRGSGPALEIRLDTATLGRDNALEEQLTEVPGLPRISGGWLLGSNAWDGTRPQLALGGTVLPSIRMGQAGLLSTVQMDASAAVPIVGPYLWFGGSMSYGWGVVELPLLATEGQFQALETATGATIPRTGACEDGCTDEFRQRTSTARAGFSVEPHPNIYAYTRGAVSYVIGTLEVQYDESDWRMTQWQVQSQSGLGLRMGNYQIGVGAVVAPRHPDLVTGEERTMAKFVASSTVRMGKPRSRTTELPPEPEVPEFWDPELDPEEIPYGRPSYD